MLEVKLEGAIYSCGGYARIRHLAIELWKQGINVKIKPFNIYDNIEFKDFDILKILEKNRVKKYVSIINGIALQFKRDRNAVYNIGYTMFEANTLASSWVECCNQMDEIWVPTHSNYDMFKVAGVIPPIRIIPYGVDTELFQYEERRNKVFTFLSLGTFIDRKGWDLLLQAYTEEFTNYDNVQLLIKLDGTNKYAKKEIRKYINNKNPTILVCDKKIDDVDIVKMYHKADCYVLPSRGEGVGLTYMEALATGCPVIATNDGGPKDYLNEKNSWMIPVNQWYKATYRLCKINTFYNNLWFAEPDFDYLKKSMREAFTNKQLCIKKGAQALKDSQVFSYKILAKRLVKVLEEIEIIL